MCRVKQQEATDYLKLVRDLMNDSSVDPDLAQNLKAASLAGDRRRQSEGMSSVDSIGINEIQRGVLGLPSENSIKDRGWQLQAAALAPQLALASSAPAVSAPSLFLLDPAAAQPQPVKRQDMLQSLPRPSAISQLRQIVPNIEQIQLEDLIIAQAQLLDQPILLPGVPLGTIAGRSNGGIKLVLVLDMEMKDIKGIEESFKQAVALDLADAIAGMREKIDIVGVQPGTIPYTLVVFAGTTRLRQQSDVVHQSLRIHYIKVRTYIIHHTSYLALTRTQKHKWKKHKSPSEGVLVDSDADFHTWPAANDEMCVQTLKRVCVARIAQPLTLLEILNVRLFVYLRPHIHKHNLHILRTHQRQHRSIMLCLPCNNVA